MKIVRYLVIHLMLIAPCLSAAYLPEPQAIPMTLQELVPDNNASAYFTFFEGTEGIEGELDLSAKNIKEITGKNIRLTSIEGIQNLKIIIDGIEYEPQKAIAGLVLDGNLLTDLPDVLRFFPITVLSVAQNRFDYMPSVIYDLLNNTLRLLFIQDNQIESLPKNFSEISPGRLNALTYFDIRNNPIEKQEILNFLKPIEQRRFVAMLINKRIQY